MLLLALDTTNSPGSLALARDGEVMASVKVDAPEGFASVLYPVIQQFLESNGAALDKIDVYAAASGPGSFTGIRIGLSASKALAEVFGKTVAPVSNLRALAAAGAGPFRCPVIDARRGEVYAAVYDERLRPVVEERVGPWELFRPTVEGRKLVFVSLDRGIFEPGGTAPLPPGEFGGRVADCDQPLAVRVAEVGWLMWKAGETVQPGEVEANYIRRSEAELKWRPTAVK